MTDASFAARIRNADKVLSASWRAVYQDKKADFDRMFSEHGDRAYGVWIQEFMGPVLEYLSADGYSVKGSFNRTDSVENWGPPEERERCIWYVVYDGDGIPVGTMVLQVYHSHLTFHVPRAPHLFAMEATEREQIVKTLSYASTRVRWDRKEERMPLPDNGAGGETGWDYATDVSIGDCLHPASDGQRSSWTLDEALSHWGRYGWDLVSVVPSCGTMVAFFKRPRRQA
ncbi:DUF6022 family protein [Paenibacillus filicis]|uniref:DUF6022 family protein n=1 Tax=Paenibacillus gyeongsangnamensis TaxID=3388067 RepID=A0ABT4Q9D7_9BACL|nr:DUF6022 family protein [Paenibacillus filicis]MCZ8513411.1 DUF6022 family protein [Paenibacillus filicis]